MSNADIARERNLALNLETNVYEDENGNEWRDENGKIMLGEYTDSQRQALKDEILEDSEENRE